MNKNFFIVILGAAMLMSVLAPVAHADDLADEYFSGENPKLTKQELRALAIARQWKAGSAAKGNPIAGRNGSVQFVFGAQEASVVCAVLQVCDISLQHGEQVNSVQLGDSARWNVEPAISGSGGAEVQHLLVKPLDVNLETSLVVTTNRRSYHMRLRSHRSEYMPQVSFIYPEETLAKWNMIRTREKQHQEKNTIPTTGEYLGNLSFDYDVSGSAPWKPVRVYDDGHKTIIQMPGSMQQTEAPTLLVVRKAGAMFTDPENVMVNYRVQGDRYIVDIVLDKAILIAGVGRNQDKITITRRTK
jgi:P-type conjugative transfer protein TrbG